MRKNIYIFFDFAGTLVKMRPATLLTTKKSLNFLSKKYMLGIVTGAKRAETINILGKLGIKKLFSTIITKDDTLYKKPDPRVLPNVKIKAYIGDGKKDELLAFAKSVPFYRVTKKCKITSIISKL